MTQKIGVNTDWSGFCHLYCRLDCRITFLISKFEISYHAFNNSLCTGVLVPIFSCDKMISAFPQVRLAKSSRSLIIIQILTNSSCSMIKIKSMCSFTIDPNPCIEFVSSYRLQYRLLRAFVFEKYSWQYDYLFPIKVIKVT